MTVRRSRTFEGRSHRTYRASSDHGARRSGPRGHKMRNGRYKIRCLVARKPSSGISFWDMNA